MSTLSSGRTDPIKLVRVISRLIIGGPTTHVLNLNAGLDHEKFDQVLVYGSANEGEATIEEVFLRNGLRITQVPGIVADLKIKPRDIKAMISLYRIMKREKPQIVHTHTAKAGALGRLAAKLAGVPIIVHTYHGHILYGYYNRRISWLLCVMESLLGCLTTKIIAVSQGVKDDLVRIGIARTEKIDVIPLGIELAPFLECENQHGKFREELGLPGDAFLVGIIGRMVPVKNHRLFVEAASMAASELPNAHFIIVGDGSLRRPEEEHAKRLGISERVHFVGWRLNLPYILSDLNVLVVSSNNEGTPVSAIEAMASGCPVIATRVGGIPDLIIHQKTGLLVEPDDAGELSEAIVSLFKDTPERKNMINAARTFVSERHDLRRLIKDTERMYDQALAGKGIFGCAG